MVYKKLIAMFTKALMFLAFAGLILLAGCKTQDVKTGWTAEPVQVDGQMTEWGDMPTSYFEDIGVLLSLCNNSENLYILFRFNNPEWARAIRMGGVTLWLDNNGKKKKNFGIRYQGGPTLSEMREKTMPDAGGFRESLTPEQQQRLLEMEKATVDQITVIDKKSDQEITMRADGSGGPAICFASPQGIYTYEFRIPLKKGDVFDSGIGTEPGQIICLGLVWGDIKMGDRQRMMPGEGREMGMPPDGGGGIPPGRGGMGGGRPGGRGGPRKQTPEKQELWVKTVLASPTGEQGEDGKKSF
jgi:hypothetical protein